MALPHYILTDLASFLHGKGKRRTLLTAEQRNSVLACCDGSACGTEAPIWATVIYSSDAALERAWRKLAAYCPELVQNATGARRHKAR